MTVLQLTFTQHTAMRILLGKFAIKKELKPQKFCVLAASLKRFTTILSKRIKKLKFRLEMM